MYVGERTTRPIRIEYMKMIMRARLAALAFATVGFVAVGPGFIARAAHAATIANPVATFDGLDKITGRVSSFDVYINETVQFGSLQLTPRACYTRPETETQRTAVFVEIDRINLSGELNRAFTGWMFADSPALNALDDPVYDVWLIDCKQSSDVPPPDQRN